MKKVAKQNFVSPFTSEGSVNTAAHNKKRSDRKSLTDKEYDELFEGILHQSLIEDAIESDQSGCHSPKQYAMLQPVSRDSELNAVLDSVLEMGGSPPNAQRMQTETSSAVEPVKNTQQPIWKGSTKTISEVRCESRSKSAAKRKKAANSAPSFSVEDLCRKKEKVKNKISKKSEKASGGKAGGKKTRRDSAESIDEPWSLTQECNKGVWIQCGNDNCCKWRHLSYMHDPSKFINAKWTCADSQEQAHNTCEAPAEHWDERADWTYNKYTEGSLVWARVDGYPWWPAMVEVDPDMKAFVFCFEHSRYTPVEYHVTFFDQEKASRAWLTPNNIKPFISSRIGKEMPTKGVTMRLRESVRQAEECVGLSLVQRLRTYGFTVRYEGQIVGAQHSEPLHQSSFSSRANKAPKSLSDNKPRRKPRSLQKKATPTSAKPAETSFVGNDQIAAPAVVMDETVCEALMPTAENNLAAISSQLVVTSSQPVVTSSQPVVTSSQPVIASQSAPYSATRGDSSQHVDLEKELDEIESILSQSLMSQRSISLSPAPQRNHPLSPASSRDNSQSNKLHNSQSGTSQSQHTSQTGSTQSKSQRGGSQSKSRSVSPAPTGQAAKKSNKKGFKCPALSGDKKKDNDVSKPTATVGGLKIANSSVFTQELSGAKTTQKSATSQSGLKLSNSSVFTQELSGKDPFTRASNVTSALHKASSQDGLSDKENTDPLTPSDSVRTTESSGRLKVADDSIFTQELSAKNPFTSASNLNSVSPRANPVDLDNSIFTQELSNKAKKGPKGRRVGGGRHRVKEDNGDDYGSYSEYSSDSGPDESISRSKLTDINSIDVSREC